MLPLISGEVGERSHTPLKGEKRGGQCPGIQALIEVLSDCIEVFIECVGVVDLFHTISVSYETNFAK